MKPSEGDDRTGRRLPTPRGVGRNIHNDESSTREV